MVCELAADSDSVHQADNRLPATRLQSHVGYLVLAIKTLVFYTFALFAGLEGTSLSMSHMNGSFV